MRNTIKLSALFLLAGVSAAHAQAVRSEKNISLELANHIAGAAVAARQANGY